MLLLILLFKLMFAIAIVLLLYFELLFDIYDLSFQQMLELLLSFVLFIYEKYLNYNYCYYFLNIYDYCMYNIL